MQNSVSFWVSKALAALTKDFSSSLSNLNSKYTDCFVQGLHYLSLSSSHHLLAGKGAFLYRCSRSKRTCKKSADICIICLSISYLAIMKGLAGMAYKWEQHPDRSKQRGWLSWVKLLCRKDASSGSVQSRIHTLRLSDSFLLCRCKDMAVAAASGAGTQRSNDPGCGPN